MTVPPRRCQRLTSCRRSCRETETDSSALPMDRRNPEVVVAMVLEEPGEQPWVGGAMRPRSLFAGRKGLVDRRRRDREGDLVERRTVQAGGLLRDDAEHLEDCEPPLALVTGRRLGQDRRERRVRVVVGGEVEVGHAVRNRLQPEREGDLLDASVEDVGLVRTNEKREHVGGRGDDHREVEVPGPLGGYRLEREA